MIKLVIDLLTSRWYSPVFSTNKSDRHDITEILLLKVTLNIIIIYDLGIPHGVVCLDKISVIFLDFYFFLLILCYRFRDVFESQYL